jgi:hypothetical protein
MRFEWFTEFAKEVRVVHGIKRFDLGPDEPANLGTS